MDDSHLKAHFRLAKCLFELSWVDEALDCLTLFKSKFPDYATSQTCEALEKDIRAAVFAKTEQGGGLFIYCCTALRGNHFNIGNCVSGA